jgi:hypothetical protein
MAVNQVSDTSDTDQTSDYESAEHFYRLAIHHLEPY